jgi:predicted PurR-regulated permease PerM
MAAAPTPGEAPGRGLQPRTALSGLLGLAALGALWAGRDFAVPLLVSVTLAVLLAPMNARLTVLLRSRVLAAVAAVWLAAAATLLLSWGVATRLSGAGERLPEVLRLAACDIGNLGVERARSMQRTRAAIAELDRSVARVTGTPGAPAAAPRPASIVSSIVDAAGGLAITSSKSMAGLALQCGAIALLSFFLLANAPALTVRLTALCARYATGPARCAPALSEVALQIRLFARVTLVTNAALGVGVALGFMAFGVPDAWLWGIAAGTLHFVPYAGLMVMMALAALEVYAAQSSLLAAVLGAGYVRVVGVVVGTAITVWLQGRAAKVDSAMLFGGTLFWAVLWGAWGLVLGPLMVVLTRLVWRESACFGNHAAAPPVPTCAAVPGQPLTSRPQAALDSG